MEQKKPVALIILDGFGLSENYESNAVAQAKKPNFDRYWDQYPHATLTACGEDVGLPFGQMGNSEVGHLNIGSGRIVYQDLTRITKDIRDGEFFKNEHFTKAIMSAKTKGKKLHVLGLLSDGGVHSHLEHLLAFLELAKHHDFKDVYIHAFLDGRDVAPDSAKTYVLRLQEKIEELQVGVIATIQGRYYAMDRDKRWERVEKSYRAMVYGEGPKFKDPIAAIEDSYQQKVYDEFVLPTVMVDEDGQPRALLSSEDSVVFLNFRPDRAIQLSVALTNPEFDGFTRGANAPSDLHFVCLTPYSEDVIGSIAYGAKNLDNTLGEVLMKNGKAQLRIAETEKYPHVTFFFSGGRHAEFKGETRVLINSPKVATYDLKPEMSAYEVAEAAVNEINKNVHDVIILNFANPDMVGHSGMLEPTIRAVEATDDCLGKVVEAILAKDGVAIITADHGNAEVEADEQGRPHTAHTTNPVPVIITKAGVEVRKDGILADLSPTILDLAHIEKPIEMTGKSLIKE